jgi:hypothetical protein
MGDRYRRLVSEAAATSGWDSGLDWHGAVELGLADDDSVLIGAGRLASWSRKPDA